MNAEEECYFFVLMRNLDFSSEISMAQFSKLDFNTDLVRYHTSTL